MFHLWNISDMMNTSVAHFKMGRLVRRSLCTCLLWIGRDFLIFAYWRNTGHVYEAVVQPRKPAHHPPSTPSVRLGPPAAVSFPARLHFRDGCESVQIRAPVAPEQRSGGRQPPRARCLLAATPSAHKTGKSQDVCLRAEREGGVGPGRAGWTSELGWLRKYKLTSFKIFRIMSFLGIALYGSLLHRMSHDMSRAQVSCGCLNPRWDVKLSRRRCSFFFFFF